MSDDPLKIITDYCKKEKKSEAIIVFSHFSYSQAYQKAIEVEKEEKGTINLRDKNLIQRSLLTEDSMNAFIDRAENLIKKVKIEGINNEVKNAIKNAIDSAIDHILAKSNKKQLFQSFGIGILASIIAPVIVTIVTWSYAKNNPEVIQSFLSKKTVIEHPNVTPPSN